MSIASEITRIQNAKTALKTSLNAKNDQQHQITNETIDNYSTFVDSITTGGIDTGAYQVSSVSEMNSLTGMDEGDICVIYKEPEAIPQTYSGGTVYFPQTVTLNSVLTGNNTMNYSSNDFIGLFYIQQSSALEVSILYMSFADGIPYEATYTSLDGLTFTRTTATIEAPVPSNTQFVASDYYQDLAQFVVTSTEPYFREVYRYETNVWTNITDEILVPSITITPTTSQQTPTVPTNYKGFKTITVNSVTSAIDSNITAENIKKDVEILGVIGTLEAGQRTGIYKVSSVSEMNELTDMEAGDLCMVVPEDPHTVHNEFTYSYVNSVGDTVEHQFTNEIITKLFHEAFDNKIYKEIKSSIDNTNAINISDYPYFSINATVNKLNGFETIYLSFYPDIQMSHYTTNIAEFGEVTNKPYLDISVQYDIASNGYIIIGKDATNTGSVILQDYVQGVGNFGRYFYKSMSSFNTVFNGETLLPKEFDFDKNIIPFIDTYSVYKYLGVGYSPLWLNISEWILAPVQTITPTTSERTVMIPQGYTGLKQVIVSGVTSSIDSNIKASNIKSGVTILGVTGSYTGN